jgi:hypothetical protein
LSHLSHNIVHINISFLIKRLQFNRSYTA